MAYLLLCSLGVDMKQHADAASQTARHRNLAGAEKGNVDPPHLPRRQRRILRVQIVGDSKEGAANLLDWNFVGFDEPLERLPAMGFELFVLLFVLGAYLVHTLATLERRYWQQEVRLPNTSTLSLSG